MNKLHKRIRRVSDMIERYHLSTCPNKRMRDEIPAWDGYAEEAVKYANHAATIAEFIYNYCATHGLEAVDFYATLEGRQVKKCIAFCREVSKEFAERGAKNPSQPTK